MPAALLNHFDLREAFEHGRGDAYGIDYRWTFRSINARMVSKAPIVEAIIQAERSGILGGQCERQGRPGSAIAGTSSLTRRSRQRKQPSCTKKGTLSTWGLMQVNSRT